MNTSPSIFVIYFYSMFNYSSNVSFLHDTKEMHRPPSCVPAIRASCLKVDELLPSDWAIKLSLSLSVSCLSTSYCPQGETGIGKSTLMNTLFNTMFENEEASHYQNGVYLRPRTYDLQESNVHLKLTIVDTVGFGDQINKEDR